MVPRAAKERLGDFIIRSGRQFTGDCQLYCDFNGGLINYNIPTASQTTTPGCNYRENHNEKIAGSWSRVTSNQIEILNFN